MILKKQINCKVYAYVWKTWKDQWKRKVRIENLLNFDMCSPIHIHIHQQSVEAFLQVYEHAFEQADAWAKQTWWQLLGSLAKI